MKLILERWNRFLKEENDSLHHTCPEAHPKGFNVYYEIDRDDPPSIEQILNCWAKNIAAIYSDSVDADKPVNYKTSELTPYREFPRQYLRNPPETQYYQDLKKYIEENGFPEALIVFFGRNGVAKIGEGNHRHEIALELGIEEVPVKFEFWKNVSKPSEQELDNLYGQKENEPREKVPEKYIKPDPPKPVSPEQQERIDYLMALLSRKGN